MRAQLAQVDLQDGQVARNEGVAGVQPQRLPDLPQAPKVTSNFTLKYTRAMGSGEVYAYTDWVYRSKVNFCLYESTEFTGKALLEGGLRMGYTWGGGKYDAAGVQTAPPRCGTRAAARNR